MLQIIGAGLSRTGTYSLHLAIERLGFKSLHFDRTRLNDVLAGAVAQPDFRRYDDFDAVIDLPSAYFYRELLDAYPASKAILTIRDVDAWWKSIAVHFNVIAPIAEDERLLHRIGAKLGLRRPQAEFDAFRRRLRNYVYGSPLASEFLYKKKFQQHNEQVIASVPPERLLIMDISAGDAWDKLCPFLGVAIPDIPFPSSHETDYENPAPWARASGRPLGV